MGRQLERIGHAILTPRSHRPVFRPFCPPTMALARAGARQLKLAGLARPLSTSPQVGLLGLGAALEGGHPSCGGPWRLAGTG